MSNYFEKFGLPKSYNINLNKLEEAFLELQQLWHPDKYLNASSEEKKHALNASLELNEAYNILKSEFKRAEYLMKLQGLNTSDEYLKTVASKELLMEAFEDRETSETLNSDNAVQTMINSTESELEVLKTQFQNHYQNNQFTECLNTFLRIRYKSKLLEELNAKLYELV